MTSKTKQFKEFAAAHKGEQHSATGLARTLGWKNHKDQKCWNAKAALRLAKKTGAEISSTQDEITTADGLRRRIRNWTITLAMVLAMLVSVGCTEQQRAKALGGSMTMTLPMGAKVVGATWKDTDLWVLTRPARRGEVPETLTLRESSSWGIAQGEVRIVEK